MRKKIFLVLFILLAVALSACTRTASSSPSASATPRTNFPTPAATSGMNAIEIAGTQTAVATSGLPMPTSDGTVTAAGTPEGAVETPVDGVIPTFTPLAGVNTTPVAEEATATPLPSPTIDPGQASPTVAVNTPVVATALPAAKPSSYVLHAGEFPYCLARRFNVNPDELLSMNNLSSGQSTSLKPGTTLSIPQTGNTFPGARALAAHPTQYTVLSGDTIYSIACHFGDVDPAAIATANSLGSDYSLTVGATIQIP